MSIIAQQTPFTLRNTTEYFLEVRIVAEQDNSFRVETDSDHVIPITEIEYAQSGSYFSAFVNTLLNSMQGKKLHEIQVNIPAKTTVLLDVRCMSTLYFRTSIKARDSTDGMDGDFELPPEAHGEPLSVTWKSELGYTYDENGDVAIGLNVPVTRDLTVNAHVHDKKKTPVDVNMYPSVCKIKL